MAGGSASRAGCRLRHLAWGDGLLVDGFLGLLFVLAVGFEAPVMLAYSARNRSASIRIPYVSSPKARHAVY